MDIHHHARTCPHSRAPIVSRLGQGQSVTQVGTDLGISERTVYKWRKSYREEGIDLAGETDHARKVSLGKQLTEHRDHVIEGHRIQRAGEAQRPALWKLERAAEE